MRIIAGRAKGRRLKSPPGREVRPTTDRIRESLFSMLGDLEGAVFVDAFAGSGALGLEAMSRGAKRGYFFDTSRRAIATVRENATRVGVEEQVVVRQCSFRQGLSNVVEGTPDLWFFDPPYGSSLAREGLNAMAECETKVTPGALVVWESSKEEEMLEIRRFEIASEKIYGRTRLIFFRCVDPES